jgi:MoxR-like ATPase
MPEMSIIVTLANTKKIDLGKQHYEVPTLLQILSTKLNVYVVGPAGAGKTTAAINCAKALDVPFHFTGAIASEFKLTGFIDAQGRIVSTEFRKAYENGGLFLFDEIDASYPQAVLAFNAALANDYMDFPDKRVTRHEKFYCIAAANTYGQGADRQYIGRNQLDGASLDRFVFLDWKYDENLERALSKNDDWVDYVQKIRKYILEQKIRHIVSPRASIFGATLLKHGISREIVEQTVIWKGIDEAAKQKIIINIAPKKIQSNIEGNFIPKMQSKNKIKKDSLIGIIEYQDRYGRKSNNEIYSPHNGLLLSILEPREVKNGETLAEIESYE